MTIKTGKKSILVISHDPALVEFIQSNLVQRGYRLISKRDAEYRLREVLKELKPDLVIVDIMAPGMSGIKISLYIRQWSPIPTILLSSWKAGKDKVRSLDVHSASCLSDPLGIDELMLWINRSS